MQTIKGVLHTLAAVHVYPPHREKKLDVASIEADCTYGTGDDGAVQMQEVHKVTGIALGDGAIATPAFPGANLRGAFQCMAEELEHTDRGDETMDRQELLQKIREEGLSPLDIFSEDVLRGVPAIKTALASSAEEATKKLSETQTEFDRTKQRLVDAENRERKAQGDLATLQQTALHSRAEGLLKGLAEERKLEGPATAFAVGGLKEFKSDAATEDALKQDLDVFLESKIKQRDSWLEAEGIKKETPPEGGGNPPTGFRPTDGDQKPPEAVSPDNEFAIDYKKELAGAMGR